MTEPIIHLMCGAAKTTDPWRHAENISKALASMRLRAALRAANAMASKGEDPRAALELAMNASDGGSGGALENLSDWRSLAGSRVDWLAPGIPMGFVTVIGGSGGVGKSRLAHALILAVLTGQPIEPWGKTDSGRVLMISGEDSSGIVLESLHAIGVAHGLRGPILDDGIGQRLDLVARPMRLLEVKRFGEVSESRDMETLRLLARRRPALIVLDTLRRCSGMTNENDAAQAGAAMAACSQLASESGGAVVLTHHVNKNPDGGGRQLLRGSSAVFDEARSVWMLTRQACGLELEHSKSNYGGLEPKRMLTMTAQGVLLDAGAKAQSWVDKRASETYQKSVNYDEDEVPF